jgi:hypothetical protein
VTAIRFSADPSSVLRALQDIQRALQRAGQAGKEFGKVDLGHPELKALADDMQKLRASMLALQRISPHSNFASGLRQSGQAGMDPWSVDWSRAFPDQRQREAALRRMLEGSGHAYAPGHQQGMPFGGAPGGAGRGGRFGAVAMGAMRWALPAALGASLAGSMFGGLRKATETSSTVDHIFRFDEERRSFDTLMASVTDVATRFGVMRGEVAKLTEVYSRARGEVADSAGAVAETIGFAKGFGMNREAAVAQLGGMEFTGALQGGRREFMVGLADMISRSGMYSRADEILGQVSRTTEKIWQASLQSPHMQAVLDLYGGLYEVGKSRTGLRGAAGESILAAADQGLRSGLQGGEAGEFLAYRALSGITPDIFAQKYMRSFGALSTPRDSLDVDDDRTLLSIFFDRFRQETGGLKNQHFVYGALGEMFGLSPRHAQALLEVEQAAKGQNIGNIRKFLDNAGLDLEDIDVSGLGHIAKILGGGGNATEEEMTKAILQAISDGYIKTRSSEMERAAAKLGDEFEKTMEGAIGPLTSIKDVLGTVLSVLSPGISQALETLQEIAVATKELVGYAMKFAERIGIKLPTAETLLRPTPWGQGMKLYQQYLRGLPSGGPLEGWFSRQSMPAEGFSGSGGSLSMPGGAAIPELPAGVPTKAEMEAVDAKYGLPRGTIWALTKVESNHNPNAVSPAGAQGIAQFMPGTAEYMGLSNPFDPHQSIDAAGKYLRYLLDKPYIGSLDEALAAYNAGPGNFQKGAYDWNEPTAHRNRFNKHFEEYQRSPAPVMHLAVHVHPKEDGGANVNVEINGRPAQPTPGQGSYDLTAFGVA